MYISSRKVKAMNETAFLLTLIVVIAGTAAFLVIIHKMKRRRIARRAHTEESLCAYLFPGDKTGVQRDELIADLHIMTGGRFSNDEVLDYYLKIKGLQMVDLNTLNDDDIRKFLMEPTKVRLHYRELVSFYEKYLNQPQVKGRSAI